MKRFFIIKVAILLGLFVAGCAAPVRQGVRPAGEPDNNALVADATSLPQKGNSTAKKASDDAGQAEGDQSEQPDDKSGKEEGGPADRPDTGNDKGPDRTDDKVTDPGADQGPAQGGDNGGIVPGIPDTGGTGNAGTGAGNGDTGGGAGTGPGGGDFGGPEGGGTPGSAGLNPGEGSGGTGPGGGGFGGGDGPAGGGLGGGGLGGGEGAGGGAGPGGDPAGDPIDNPKGERTDVPDVRGLTLAVARAKLTEAGFKVKLVKRNGRPVAFQENQDTVDTQKPAPGTRQRPSKFGKGGTVALEVAVKVPNVTNNNLRVALRKLSDRNLRATFSAEDLKQLRDRKINVDSATRGGPGQPNNPALGRGADDITVTSQTPGADNPTVKQGTAVRLRLRFTGTQNGKVTVPAVVGETFTEARRRLEQAGLKVKGGGRGQETRRVTSQNPAAGTRVDRGSEVELRFDAQGTVRVPAVTGVTYREAKRRLEEVGLTINRVDRAQENAVVRTQNPAAGTARARGTVVVVGFGDQAGTVRVPRVVGLTFREAKRRLEQAGLRVNNVNNTPETATVRTQEPAADTTVRRGTTVALTFSTTLIRVPNVVGLTYQEARRRLEQAGLRVNQSGNNLERRVVRTQVPPAGTQVRQGTQVVLTLAPTGPGGGGTQTRNGTVTVPRVTGLTVEEARRALAAVGLSLRFRSNVRTGRASSQVPAAGTRVASGDSVTVGFTGTR